MRRQRRPLQIDFIAPERFRDVLPEPAPSVAPQWLLDLPAKIAPERGFTTIKRCPPFRDACTAGYMISLSADVLVDHIDGLPRFHCHAPWSVLSGQHSEEQAPSASVGGEIYKWANLWHISAPKGVSVQINHPHGRDDLPFRTLPGIVDVDAFTGTIQFPFVWLGDGSSTYRLDRGTPIAQVIPFERQRWRSRIRYADEQLLRDLERPTLQANAEADGYRKRHHTRKEYL